ncbi:hypothetical protein C7271_26920 [filamentous cyanobacterium CCP5]|nr:hypothetical protein C7271_26920 [filamentous cyanobacterium CCP5]
MSQDVSQWLTEIRTLQRQLADVRKERDQALTSAANWRRLYETEARQRRHELETWRSQVQSQAVKTDNSEPARTGSTLEPSSAASSIQAQLEAALARCQDLASRLQAEQEAHSRTRKTLTTALGETFDTLKAKEMAYRDDHRPA